MGAAVGAPGVGRGAVVGVAAVGVEVRGETPMVGAAVGTPGVGVGPSIGSPEGSATYDGGGMGVEGVGA